MHNEQDPGHAVRRAVIPSIRARAVGAPYRITGGMIAGAGAMALGTRNHIRFKMWGLPLTATSLVTEWEPGSRKMLENVKPSRPTRAIATHSFEPADSGCRHTWRVCQIFCVFGRDGVHRMWSAIRSP